MWTEISSSMSAINVRTRISIQYTGKSLPKNFYFHLFFFNIKRRYCNLKLYLKAYKLNLVWENFEQGKVFYEHN